MIIRPSNLAAYRLIAIAAATAATMLAGCTGAATPSPSPQAEMSTQQSTPLSAAIPTHEPGCTVRSDQQPDPTVESLLSPVTEKDWTKGPDDAYVTIMDYSDFQ